MSAAKSITVISSPFHLGIRNVAVGGGPTALLKAGLVDAIRKQGVTVNQVELEPVDELDGDISRLFELLRRTSRTVTQMVRAGSFPIMLAGNCSATVGVQAGVVAALDKVPACVWFDAHDDFNTPDVLASGYLDSMPVAMLAGLCWKTLLASIPGFKALDLKRDLVHCGMRDVTDLERSRVAEAGFPVIWGDTSKHVDFEAELCRVLEEKKLGETMVHLDLDALDVSIGNVNKFSAAGGLLEEDLTKCLGMIPDKAKPVSLTVASFDPSFDEHGKIPPVAIRGVVSFVQSLISRGIVEV
ncbi:arginase [Fusarium heterosporum]|uniref:Arginase n=1 Tax=Fusarium heterosporum TaxID=42747 RepID=A0A8H5WVF0_FUSHE|nr:arginase [Fusarium heterosporum]